MQINFSRTTTPHVSTKEDAPKKTVIVINRGVNARNTADVPKIVPSDHTDAYVPMNVGPLVNALKKGNATQINVRAIATGIPGQLNSLT